MLGKVLFHGATFVFLVVCRFFPGVIASRDYKDRDNAIESEPIKNKEVKQWK